MSLDSLVAVVGKVSERRSMRWVEPQFQRRYAILLVSIVALVATVLLGSFWYHQEQVLLTLRNAGVLVEHPLYHLIDRQMSSLFWSVLAVSVFIAIFIFMTANYLSHRIVGPIFAVKRSLEQIGSGQFEEARIQLRQGDEFQDVATLVNQVVDRLQKSKQDS